MSKKLDNRERARRIFNHGFNGYMRHAWPKDELMPLSCKGVSHDPALPDLVNDVLGNFSLTLIDNLDTLALMGHRKQFRSSVEKVLSTVTFDQDVEVQVFEVSIRVLGGLLSGHLMASDPRSGVSWPGYSGGLLRLAVDVADRLIVAFRESFLPFRRVNLRHGVIEPKTDDDWTTPLAGAGSLLLEFGQLSVLTGDPKYAIKAHVALVAMWNQRNYRTGLPAHTIDLRFGNWTNYVSSIGGGMDSFYEYMLKCYSLLGHEEYLQMFEYSYDRIMEYTFRTPFFVNVDAEDGLLSSTWVDNLQPFFPGLQVLYGDVQSAAHNHRVWHTIWQHYKFIPERYNIVNGTIESDGWELRPEFVESTYHLYRATKDPYYLQVGEEIMNNIEQHAKTECGYAIITKIKTLERGDVMHSFFLAETVKYLFLLFDEDNVLHNTLQDHVFGTEAHIFLPQWHGHMDIPHLARTQPDWSFAMKHPLMLQNLRRHREREWGKTTWQSDRKRSCNAWGAKKRLRPPHWSGALQRIRDSVERPLKKLNAKS